VKSQKPGATFLPSLINSFFSLVFWVKKFCQRNYTNAAKGEKENTHGFGHRKSPEN